MIQNNMNNLMYEGFLSFCTNAIVLNLKTGKCTIQKSNSELLHPGQELDFTPIIEMSSAYIYAKDRSHYCDTLSISELRQLASLGESGTFMSFRSFYLDENGHLCYRWNNLALSIPTEYSEENPIIIIYSLLSHNQNDIVHDARSFIEAQFHRYVKINLKTEEILNFNATYMDQESYKNALTQTYTQIFEYAKQHSVHREDLEFFDKTFCISNIRDHFKSSDSDLTLRFRHRNGSEYIWVKATVAPAVEYSKENPIVLFLSTDVNVEALEYISDLAIHQYEQFINRKEHGLFDYYSEILNLMKVFTEPYLFYLTIDLDKDAYISYKSGNPFHRTDGQIGGRFSSMINKYITDNYDDDTTQKLLSFANLEQVKQNLVDKATISYRFTDKSGKKILCTFAKIESTRSNPSKVIFFGVPDPEANNLLVVKTFGYFEVYDSDGNPIRFEKKQSKQVLALLIDRKGYPVTINDVILEVLEKSTSDLNAKKYASALLRKTMRDLTNAGYPNVIQESNHSYRVNRDAVDCDYYHLIDGNSAYWAQYHNEYMNEYSWAEETNADLLQAHKR